LRSNRNIEQACLLYHAALQDWHAAWIDGLVSHGQVNESGSDATG
jgi:hypothetical protein